MSNVFGFGAVGDGITDDTESLQHAIDSGDGVVRLNKGTYRITKPLILDLTKTGFGAVRGEGGSSRIVMAGAGPAIRVIGDHRGTASPGTVQRHLHARPDPGNLTKGRLDASHRLQELPVRLPEFLANGTGLCMLCEGLCIHLAQVVPIVFRALDPGAPEGPVVARPWPGGYGL